MKLILIGALLLSIVQSILFYEQNLGISVLIFAICFFSFIVYVLRKNEKIQNPKAFLLGIPIVLLSANYFIFNSTFFNVLNMPICILLFFLMVTLATNTNLQIVTLGKQLLKNVFLPFEYFTQIGSLIKQAFGKEKNKEKKKSAMVKQILLTILCSLPLILVILILLTLADSMFADIFGNIGSFILSVLTAKNILSFIIRLIVILFFTFYFTGLFCYLTKQEKTEQKPYTAKKLTLPTVTQNTLLTIINSIYLVFCYIQIVYVFRQNYLNENYANSARTGFFQLMLVSIINFVILLITKHNATKTSKSAFYYTKIMNILLVVFTIIMIFSSFTRMHIYEQEFGYTFLRLFVYFILTITLVFMIPTILSILGIQVKMLKWCGLITLVAYLIFNYMNVDALMAKRNIQRYYDNPKKGFDYAYLKKATSTDAFEEMIDLYEQTTNDRLKKDIVTYLYENYKELKKSTTIFEFNSSKEHAKRLLEEMQIEEKYSLLIKDNFQNSNNLKSKRGLI